MFDATQVMAWIGTVIDAVGVLTIAIGTTLATTRYIIRRQGTPQRSYPLLRQNLAGPFCWGWSSLLPAT